MTALSQSQSTPVVLAKAAFTKDMVTTLQDYFACYAVDGVVTVEVTSHGLWLPNPHVPMRQFLGSASRFPTPLPASEI